MVNDLTSLLLSKSVVGEQHEIETDDIKVKLKASATMEIFEKQRFEKRNKRAIY